MNNNRRKKIKDIEQDILYCINNKIYDILLFSNIKGNILTVLIEEEECYENYPENLQNSFRGEAMQDAIEYLENALFYMEEIIKENKNNDINFKNISNNLNETFKNLFEAKYV